MKKYLFHTLFICTISTAMETCWPEGLRRRKTKPQTQTMKKNIDPQMDRVELLVHAAQKMSPHAAQTRHKHRWFFNTFCCGYMPSSLK